MRRQGLRAIAFLVIAGAFTWGGTLVFAHDSQTTPAQTATFPTSPTEDTGPARDELVPDPEAGKPPLPAKKGEPPRTFEPGRAQVVAPDSELGRRFNPSGDPTVRICREPDGTVWYVHRTPVPGKNPYPTNDPEDLRTRPC
jgi:hypothetical protein